MDLSTNKNQSVADDAPPPWDLRLYAREETFARASPEIAQRDAAGTWDRFLSQRPLLYLPDRTPHGDWDVRLTHGRHLWRRDELLAFDAVVMQRTQALLQQQQTVLHHWQTAATQIQAHARGLLARCRVQRMRQQLDEASRAALQARERAEVHRRQLQAAIRIQIVYHRRCNRLRFVVACRQRIERCIRLYIFRWERQRAARVLQRAFRNFRRRVSLATALHSLLRLLRLSRQRDELDAAARAFHQARHAAQEREREVMWTRHPLAMANATRVHDRKAKRCTLQPTTAPHRPNNSSSNASLPLLPKVRPTWSPPLQSAVLSLPTIPTTTPSRHHHHHHHHLPHLSC